VFLRIKSVMEFVFEEHDHVYQLHIPAEQPAVPPCAPSSASSLNPSTHVVTSSASAINTKRMSEQLVDAAAHSLLPASTSRKPVKGKGPFYQPSKYNPYDSPTLLEWLGNEVLEHQYTILVFYRGQWYTPQHLTLSITILTTCLSPSGVLFVETT